MRTHLKRHLSQMSEGADEGFTLIELLVVLLILGILLAIAIPTFLTVTKSATNTAVTSNLQTALTGSETFYTQNAGSYNGLTTSTTVSTISQQGTGLSYASTTAGAQASYGPKSISIDILGSNADLVLAAWNGSTRCYVIVAEKGNTIAGNVPSASGTWYGWYTSATAAGCTAATGISGNSTGVSAAAGAAGGWSETGGFPS